MHRRRQPIARAAVTELGHELEKAQGSRGKVGNSSRAGNFAARRAGAQRALWTGPKLMVRGAFKNLLSRCWPCYASSWIPTRNPCGEIVAPRPGKDDQNSAFAWNGRQSSTTPQPSGDTDDDPRARRNRLDSMVGKSTRAKGKHSTGWFSARTTRLSGSCE